MALHTNGKICPVCRAPISSHRALAAAEPLDAALMNDADEPPDPAKRTCRDYNFSLRSEGWLPSGSQQPVRTAERLHLAEEGRGGRFKNTSGYVGVRKMSSGRFEAKHKLNGRQTYLGTFDTAVEAAVVYAKHVQSLNMSTGACSSATTREGPPADMHELLERARLLQYEAIFLENGWDDAEWLLDAPEAQLDQLAEDVGMKFGHLVKLKAYTKHVQSLDPLDGGRRVSAEAAADGDDDEEEEEDDEEVVEMDAVEVAQNDESRVVTEAAGMQLQLSTSSTTGYCGVREVGNGRFQAEHNKRNGRQYPKRFAAAHKKHGKYTFLGTFDTAVEAAIAYAKSMQSLGGQSKVKEQEVEQVEQDDENRVLAEAAGMRLHLSRHMATGYRGVSSTGGRFQARYGRNETYVNLGTYATAVEAAVAYAMHVQMVDADEISAKLGHPGGPCMKISDDLGQISAMLSKRKRQHDPRDRLDHSTPAAATAAAGGSTAGDYEPPLPQSVADALECSRLRFLATGGSTEGLQRAAPQMPHAWTDAVADAVADADADVQPESLEDLECIRLVQAKRQEHFRRLSDAESAENEKERRPNRMGLNYRCGRCGQTKKGHVCNGKVLEAREVANSLSGAVAALDAASSLLTPHITSPAAPDAPQPGSTGFTCLDKFPRADPSGPTTIPSAPAKMEEAVATVSMANVMSGAAAIYSDVPPTASPLAAALAAPRATAAAAAAVAAAQATAVAAAAIAALNTPALATPRAATARAIVPAQLAPAQVHVAWETPQRLQPPQLQESPSLQHPTLREPSQSAGNEAMADLSSTEARPLRPAPLRPARGTPSGVDSTDDPMAQVSALTAFASAEAALTSARSTVLSTRPRLRDPRDLLDPSALAAASNKAAEEAARALAADEGARAKAAAAAAALTAAEEASAARAVEATEARAAEAISHRPPSGVDSTDDPMAQVSALTAFASAEAALTSARSTVLSTRPRLRDPRDLLDPSALAAAAEAISHRRSDGWGGRRVSHRHSDGKARLDTPAGPRDLLDPPPLPPAAASEERPFDIPIGARIEVLWRDKQERAAWYIGTVIDSSIMSNGRRCHHISYDAEPKSEWYWHDLASGDFEWRHADDDVSADNDKE